MITANTTAEPSGLLIFGIAFVAILLVLGLMGLTHWCVTTVPVILSSISRMCSRFEWLSPPGFSQRSDMETGMENTIAAPKTSADDAEQLAFVFLARLIRAELEIVDPSKQRGKRTLGETDLLKIACGVNPGGGSAYKDARAKLAAALAQIPPAGVRYRELDAQCRPASLTTTGTLPPSNT